MNEWFMDASHVGRTFRRTDEGFQKGDSLATDDVCVVCVSFVSVVLIRRQSLFGWLEDLHSFGVEALKSID
jgi:hypothetical protein